MVPAKPMVSKKPTPPVQNIETWATFEPPSPPEENLHLIRCKHNIGAPAVSLEHVLYPGQTLRPVQRVSTGSELVLRMQRGSACSRM